MIPLLNRKIASLALIPFFLVIIIILAFLNIKTVFEPLYLLTVLNFLFIGFIPLMVSFFAFRTFRTSGSIRMLLMGAGMVVFGLGSIISGLLITQMLNASNINVTIFNSCACIASIFFLIWSLANLSGPEDHKRKGSILTIYALSVGLFILVILFSLATVMGLVPPFFIQGTGPTTLRQVVLSTTIQFFLISSALTMYFYTRKKTDFFFWFSVSFALISVGLMAVFLQTSVGSLIGWAGRSAQYLGGIFALIAILGVWKSAIRKNVSLEEIIANFFVDAEKSYQQLVETATDAIISYDEDYRVLLWNAAAERMFGYTRDEAVGASFLQLAIDDRYTAVIKNHEGNPPVQSSDAAAPLPVEIFCKRKDGTLFPAELTISRRWQDTRRISTIILRDLTKRKRDEDRVRETKEYLENLIQNASAPIITWDPDFKITEFNHAFELLTSMKREEVLGQPLQILFPEESCETSMDQIRWTSHGGQWNAVEIRIRSGSGGPRLVLWNSTSLRDNEGLIVATIAQGLDITERKAAEEALRQSEKTYRNLVESISDILFTLDPDHTITYISPVVRILGLTNTDVKGRSFDDFILPEDLPIVEKAAHDVLSGSDVEIEFRICSRSKDIFHVHVSARPEWKDGNITGIAGIMKDITSKKDLERLKVEALQKIEENLIEMAVLNDQIRNPLAVIMASADLAGGSTAEAIIRQVQEIDAMINKIDRKWIESVKVREFLKKYYGVKR